MTTKRMIWLGAAVGSTLGGLLPSLWHASMFSVSSIVFSTIGAILGVWLGWRASQGF